MAKKRKSGASSGPSGSAELTIQFNLTPSEKKKILDCISKTGKLKIVMEETGDTSLGLDVGANWVLQD